MGAAIGVVLRPSPRPDLVVVITDGCTPWPEVKPVRAIIVVILPSGVDAEESPNWARVVRMILPLGTSVAGSIFDHLATSGRGGAPAWPRVHLMGDVRSQRSALRWIWWPGLARDGG
jgi:hypothetical protein